MIKKYIAALLIGLSAFPVQPAQAALSQADKSELGVVSNYISNGGIERGKVGFVTYANTAQATPVSGTGGSPSHITIAASTSSPLSGNASLVITNAGSTSAQGEGVSYNFSIDAKDQAKVLGVKFDYAAGSGFVSGSGVPTVVDSDLEVYLYDVTNSTVIQPAGYIVTCGVSVNCTFSSTFQTASNSTSYRLIFHVPTTHTAAWTFKADNISVGPQASSSGAAMSDWTSYSLVIGGTTTAPTPGTLAVNNAKWRRVGDSMEINFDFEQTSNSGGAAGSGLYTFPIPSGYSIDSSKITTSATYMAPIVGVAGVASGTSASNAYTGVVQIRNSTNLELAVGNDTSNPSSFIGSTYLPINGNNVYNIGFTALVPIVGWSSNTVQSSDSAQNVVQMTSLQNTPSGTPVSGGTIVFSGVTRDSNGAYNVSTGEYSCPVTGEYSVNETTEINSTAPGSLSFSRIFIQVAGATQAVGPAFIWPAGSIGYVFPTVNAIVHCNAGQKITTVFNSNIGGTLGYSNNYSGSSLSIARLSGPAVVQATETVALSRTTDEATSLTSTNTIQLTWNTSAIDDHSGWSTNKYVIPVSGTYEVTSSIRVNKASGWALGDTATYLLYKNSSLHSVIAEMNSSVSGSYNQSTMGGTVLIKCNAGDTLDTRVYMSVAGGAASALVANTQYNRLSIVRVGN